MSAASDFLGGATPKIWVTGTTYAAGKVVWSPTDYQYYMRKTAGAGATDPASDTTNWQPTGARAVKSIQRGSLTIAGGTSSNTATVTSVVTGKSLLSKLGETESTAATTGLARIVLTNGTTITATRGANPAQTTVISWELVETY